LAAETVLAEDTQAARFLSSYHWTKERDGFGGYSGISLTPDGSGFVILSDRAHLIEGTIFRHNEQIIGVRSTEMAALNIPDAFFRNPSVQDTEGLAKDGQGRLYISLESTNRVLCRDTAGIWTALPDHPEIRSLPDNRGLEALAIEGNDTLFAIPEVSDGLNVPFPVFRYRPGKGWDAPMSISRNSGFVPVGADVGPDGRLYVLERGFGGFGFSSRVRRFDPFNSDDVDGETLLTTEPRRHDNLEGLSVWAATDGTLRLTMISDDNFFFLQKTEIVEYALAK
jgi:hypothetical protein